MTKKIFHLMRDGIPVVVLLGNLTAALPNLMEPFIRRSVFVTSLILAGYMVSAIWFWPERRTTAILSDTGDPLDITKRPIHKIWLWGGAFLVIGAVFALDLALSEQGTFDMAEVRDVKTPNKPQLNGLPENGLLPRPFEPVAVDHVQMVDESKAREFYKNPLGEAVQFDLVKRRFDEHVVVDDIIVTVHQWEPVSDRPAFAKAVNHAHIIIVELHRKTSPPPWTFHPKYLLDDPHSESVHPWHTVQLTIDNDAPQKFFVKIAARDSGRYTYSVKAMLKSRRGVEEHQLVTDQVCEFREPVHPMGN